MTIPSATVATSGIIAGASLNRLMTSRSSAMPSPPTAAMAIRHASPRITQVADPPMDAANA